MNVTKAAEWLLEQEAFKDSDLPEEPSTSHSHPSTVFEAFQNLLHFILRSRQENFKVNFKYEQKLKALGYEEQDIEKALRETDNNLKAAVCVRKRKLLNYTLVLWEITVMYMLFSDFIADWRLF